MGRDGRLARTRTLERTYAYDTDYGGQVTAAVGGDGRALVAFATAHAKKRQVDVFLRARGGRFGPRVIAGPHEGSAALSAVFSAAGRATVAWGTQDGGEEANKPWRISAATSTPTLRSMRLQTLDPGDALDRPLGTVAAAATPDGRVAVGWSAITDTGPPEFDPLAPVRVAIAPEGGRFAAPQQLAADGALSGLAAGPDGALLATWSQGQYEGDAAQAFSALQPAGAGSFEAAEAIAPPDTAGPPLAAFLADGRPIAAWAAQATDTGGSDRPQAVVRVAIR